MAEGVVQMAHGGGGTRMQDLLRDMIFPALGGQSLEAAEDAAQMPNDVSLRARPNSRFTTGPAFTRVPQPRS